MTTYLDRAAVEVTLGKIASTAPSTVAFDYVSSQLIESNSLGVRYAWAALRAPGGCSAA